MLLRVSAAAPVLVSLTVCTALLVPTACAAKLSDAGLSDTTGAAMPVPLRLIVLGLLTASLVITRLPLKAPTETGANVTLMLQLAAFASVAPQVVLLTPNSPFTTMLLILSTAPPGLLTVMV